MRVLFIRDSIQFKLKLVRISLHFLNIGCWQIREFGKVYWLIYIMESSTVLQNINIIFLSRPARP